MIISSLEKIRFFQTKPCPPISLTLSASLSTPYMSLVIDTLKSSIMYLSLLTLETRVVCGGIPVMYMVSVVASHGNTVRTYGSDGILLVYNNVHLTAHIC